MSDCLFCKIIAGEIPCHKIYEDTNFLAFLDITPVNPGHTLIIPKKHSRTLLDMGEKETKEIMFVVKKIASHIQKKLEADGINVINNTEATAGQVIFHTHIHIIPRFERDGFKHWKGTAYLENKAMDLAEILKIT